MFQSLTGRLPHEGPDLLRMITEITQQDVDLDGLDVSESLREVLRTSLARGAADRYQEPDEFLAALREAPEAAAVEDV